jgi:1,4-dihydroxy-2-naphthoate octaprenyltransferase
MNTPFARSKSIALLRLARPEILIGGIAAYLLGTSIGISIQGSFSLFHFLVGFLLTEIANLSAHFFDEYADLDTDTLTRRTIMTGGSGVLPAGLQPPSTALRMGTGFAALAVVLILLFAFFSWIPWVSALVVLFGLLGGWAYSMKPLQLERRGLAEVTNGFIGGMLMPLMGLTVQTGSLTLQNASVLLPVFLIVTTDLLGIHWPDREADLAVGKRTLAGLLGDRMPFLFGALVVVAYGLSFWLAPVQVALVTLLVLPFQIWALVMFRKSSSPAYASAAMGTYLIAYGIGWL